MHYDKRQTRDQTIRSYDAIIRLCLFQLHYKNMNSLFMQFKAPKAKASTCFRNVGKNKRGLLCWLIERMNKVPEAERKEDTLLFDFVERLTGRPGSLSAYKESIRTDYNNYCKKKASTACGLEVPNETSEENAQEKASRRKKPSRTLTDCHDAIVSAIDRSAQKSAESDKEKDGKSVLVDGNGENGDAARVTNENDNIRES